MKKNAETPAPVEETETVTDVPVVAEESGQVDPPPAPADVVENEPDQPAKAAQPVRDLPRLMTRIFGTPLMMSAAKIDVVMAALGPRLGLSAANTEKMAGMFDDGDGDGDGVPYEVTQDGIARIQVDGTLVYKSSWLGALSGLTGYGDIRSSLDAAMADGAVKGILLEIDSYGGECNGCFDLSDAVFAARSKKPIYAVAADDAYSAAYALASSASKLFVSRTSGVGSIGVVALHIDQSAADKADGLKYTYVKAGEKKTDGNPHEPLSSSAKETIQGECDRLWELFASSVAKYRGLSVETIKSMQAGCFFGELAVGAKLADAIGTPDDALQALRAELSRAGTGGQPITMAAEIVEKGEKPPAQETTGNVVDLNAMRDQLHGEFAATAVEIVELCTLAGKANLASGFIKQKIGTAAVRRELQTLRAQASDAQGIHGRIMPDAGGTESQQNVSKSWDNAFAAASGQNKEK